MKVRSLVLYDMSISAHDGRHAVRAVCRSNMLSALEQNGL